MFTKLGPNSAKSDEGFVVSIVSRDEMEYKEGNKSLLVGVEPGDGLVIYTSSIVWWETESEKEYVSKRQKAKIIKNICNALGFLKIKYIVE